MRRIFKLSVLCLAAGVVNACSTPEQITATENIPTAGVRFINAVPDTNAMDFRFIDIVENHRSPARLGFRSWLLGGLALGGLAFSLTLGHFEPGLSYGSAPRIPGQGELALLVAAGVAMGLGARTAGGCTSGHGMSGMSLGSPASIVASVTFFATAVAVALGTAWVGGAR